MSDFELQADFRMRLRDCDDQERQLGDGLRWIGRLAFSLCKGRGLDVGATFNGQRMGLPGAKVIDPSAGPARAEAMPDVRSGSQDFVFSSHTLEHVADPELALAEFKRVLRVNGLLFLYLPFPGHREWDPALCEAARGQHKWQPDPTSVGRMLVLRGFTPFYVENAADPCGSFVILARKQMPNQNNDLPDSSFAAELQHGLGDNIYARGAVKALAADGYSPIWLRTPWPQFFADIAGVRFVRTASSLRTQSANIARGWGWGAFDAFPRSVTSISLDYINHREMLEQREGTIVDALMTDAPTNAKYDMTIDVETFRERALAECDVIGLNPDHPFALVHYPTVRTEWACPARNPRANAIAEAVEALPLGVAVVSVAWVHPPAEVWTDERRPATHRAEAGELTAETIAWLANRARVVIAPPGYLLPLTIAAGGRLLCVFGGHMAPDVLFDKRMGPGTWRAVAPSPFCHCLRNEHSCRKDLDRGMIVDALKELVGA